jgi:hypothetical protein
MKNKQYYTAEQVQNEKQTILYYTAGTVIKWKTNNTTLPEQVQNEK